MTDEFAFRASEALEREVRAALARLDHWDATVLLPWQDSHPDVAPLWVVDSHGTGADKRCVGFSDAHPDRDPPEGLSRNRQRRELRPARGRAGDPWRELLERFSTRPKVAPVFALHGVELAIIDLSASMLRRPALLLSSAPGETGMWMKYKGRAPRDTEALTSIPVSEFHRAMEDMDARDAQRKAAVAATPAPVGAGG